MAPDPDSHPVIAALLSDAPAECRPVAELYRHSARRSEAEAALREVRGPFFIFCEQLGLAVFDEDLDVRYEEIMPLDDEAQGLLRLALLAHQEHPEVVEDYAARLYWAQVRDGHRGAPPR